MKITTIEKKSVNELVFEQLREMIVSGTWKPGQRIPSENELKEMFQVSRVTIREALKKLASYNIVEARQGSGTYIKQLDPGTAFDSSLAPLFCTEARDKSVRDMMEFRNMIEVSIVSMAAERANKEECDKLEEIYNHMIENRLDVRAFSEYDLEFHRYLAEMTRNSVLIKCYSVVWSYMQSVFENVVEAIGVEKGIHYHGLILDAIIDHDAETARRLMDEHLTATADTFFAK